MTIDILPEDVFLEIFDHYVDPTRISAGIEAWCTLTQVCRKWRNIVLESPHRLNLRIRCHPAKPVREKLDIWPDLPIFLAQCDEEWQDDWGVDNVLVALEQNNRICHICLYILPSQQLEEILAAMHKPFPALTHLDLMSEEPTLTVDPDLFLGGSAPCLRYLQLYRITFPRLPQLLSSATHLTDLHLVNIPFDGYISPETMVSCLSALTRLKSLKLEFEDPESIPVWEHQRPPPHTRSPLPALTWLEFSGIGEYLEDLVDRISAPVLDALILSFFPQSIPDTGQLAQFINRTPKLKTPNKARVLFRDSSVFLVFRGMSYGVVAREFSSVAEVWTSSFSQAFSPTVERLYVSDKKAYWQGDMGVENNHWLEILRPFTSVKSLYLSREIVQRIAPALQEIVRERVVGFLPSLKTLFLEDLNISGPVQEAIDLFVSARQFSSHPVAVSHWKGKSID